MAALEPPYITNSKKVLADRFVLFLQQLRDSKKPAANAIRYALNRRQSLTRFLDNGAIEIDNSAAERVLRCVAVGRKNYLFLDSDNGAIRAATQHSLLGTGKLNGVNTEKHLTHVQSVILDHKANKVDELLPWNVKQ